MIYIKSLFIYYNSLKINLFKEEPLRSIFNNKKSIKNRSKYIEVLYISYKVLLFI